MGGPGTIRVRLLSPRPAEATVKSWFLPAYGAAMPSASLLMAVGANDHFFMQPRIAQALCIRDGDEVQVQFTDVGETFTFRIKIRDSMSSDVLIHDFMTLGVAREVSYNSREGFKVKLSSGQTLWLEDQKMWAGLRVVKEQGAASLHFDGASKNNPEGPAGYGYRISVGETGHGVGAGDELIRGYGYCGMNRTSNEVEYQGLIEGLTWAMRLDLTRLDVYGDSELVIRQLNGDYKVAEPRLKVLYAQTKDLLQKNSGLVVSFRHIPREENTVADALANMAIDTRENMTACSWPNINRLMYSA